MQYYESTNATGIVDDIYYQTNTDTTTYPLGILTSHVNRGYAEIITAILSVDRRWRWDDRNHTKSMETTCDLVTDQGEYGFLSSTPAETYQDFSKVFGVAVKDQNADWRDLDYITKDLIKERGFNWDEYESVSGTPIEYALEGTQLFLKPAPSYDSTNWCKVFMQRNPVFFARTDTTKVPGFDQRFHILLSYYGQMGYQACKNRGELQALIDRGLINVRKVYSERMDEQPRKTYYYPNWK